MSVLSLNQLLALYLWFPLVVVLGIFMLIARFYQQFVGKRMFFWWYLLPMVFYGAASVRYASVEHLTGDLWGDVFGAMGGVLLFGLTTFLFVHMMRRKL